MGFRILLLLLIASSVRAEDKMLESEPHKSFDGKKAKKYFYHGKPMIANVLLFTLGSYVGWQIGKKKHQKRFRWSDNQDITIYKVLDFKDDVSRLKDYYDRGIITKKQFKKTKYELKGRVGIRSLSKKIKYIDITLSNIEDFFMMYDAGGLTKKEYEKQVKEMLRSI